MNSLVSPHISNYHHAEPLVAINTIIKFIAMNESDVNSWNILPSPKGKFTLWSPVRIGTCIWRSTQFNDGEKGMVQFCCVTDTIQSVADYPEGFRPFQHTMCQCHDRSIAIVDGKSGALVLFDPIEKRFSDPIAIPKIGSGCSCVAVKDQIHIFHGGSNSNSEYAVFSVSDNEVTTFLEHKSSPLRLNGSISKQMECTVYNDRTMLCIYGFSRTHSVNNVPDDILSLIFEYYNVVYCTFGGFISETNSFLDSFYIGSINPDNAREPILWNAEAQYTLPKPLEGCGHVHYGPFLIICGGQTTDFQATDDIFVLDLRKQDGWMQSSLKCPKKSAFTAVLEQLNVHLFTYNPDEESTHTSINMNQIIPDEMWLNM